MRDYILFLVLITLLGTGIAFLAISSSGCQKIVVMSGENHTHAASLKVDTGLVTVDDGTMDKYIDKEKHKNKKITTEQDDAL